MKCRTTTANGILDGKWEFDSFHLNECEGKGSLMSTHF